MGAAQPILLLSALWEIRHLTLLFVVVAFGITLFGIYELQMIVRFWRQKRVQKDTASTENHASNPDSLPAVLVQLPIFNEREVVPQLLHHISLLDYPPELLTVQVLDDSTDDTPQAVAQAIADLPKEKSGMFHHIRRGTRDGFKAGALAHGMALDKSDFIAIFDADFTPPPDFLRRAVRQGGAFDDPTVAFVQGRWTYYNSARSLFAKVQSVLIDRHFLIQKPYQVGSGNDITFNGSAGLWRRSAIELAGGWSGRTICEDLDLTYRCVMLGMNGAYDSDLECPNEIPSDILAFKLQQRRWAKGTAQNMVNLLPSIVRFGSGERRANNLFAISGYLVHPFLLIYTVIWPILVLGGVDIRLLWSCQFALILGNFVAAAGFASTYIQRSQRPVLANAVLEVLFAMALGISLMVNNSIAFVTGLFERGGVFERTPKVGIGNVKSAESRAKLHWSVLPEMLLGIYGTTASLIMFAQGYFMEAQQTLLFGLLMLSVVLLQIFGVRMSHKTYLASAPTEQT